MSGWYPDPTGRFEYRFHNDREWTADVSTGGQRFVDPMARSLPAQGGGNGLAVAGMVCGIVAVVIAWVPFVAVLGLITAVVGLALSIPALARSRSSGDRRGFAIAGIVTSTTALAAGVLGIVLTVALVRAFDAFDDPGPHDARLTACATQADGVIVARGEVENLGDEEQTYTVLVQLAPGNRERVEVEDVPAGATGEFTADSSSRSFGSSGEPRCRIVSVDGPMPFGLDPEFFD